MQQRPRVFRRSRPALLAIAVLLLVPGVSWAKRGQAVEAFIEAARGSKATRAMDAPAPRRVTTPPPATVPTRTFTPPARADNPLTADWRAIQRQQEAKKAAERSSTSLTKVTPPAATAPANGSGSIRVSRGPDAGRGALGGARAQPDRKKFAASGPLPRAENGDFKPLPGAQGQHSTLGTRTSKKRGETYRQGATFDDQLNFTGRTDVTDHGRPQNHPNPHFHPARDSRSVGSAEKPPEPPPNKGGS